MEKEQAEQLKRLLGIPSEVHISELPNELLPFSWEEESILLKGKKRQWENTRDSIDYNISLSIRNGKFVIRKSNFLDDEDIEEETYIFRPILLDDNFDSLFLEDCSESFCMFLIDNGYEDILKKKILK